MWFLRWFIAKNSFLFSSFFSRHYKTLFTFRLHLDLFTATFHSNRCELNVLLINCLDMYDVAIFMIKMFLDFNPSSWHFLVQDNQCFKTPQTNVISYYCKMYIKSRVYITCMYVCFVVLYFILYNLLFGWAVNRK